MNKSVLIIYEKFGKKHQLKKLSEEVYELQEAILCNDNREHIIEELADVSVLYTQLLVANNITVDEISKKADEKIERTIKRIEEGYYDD